MDYVERVLLNISIVFLNMKTFIPNLNFIRNWGDFIFPNLFSKNKIIFCKCEKNAKNKQKNKKMKLWWVVNG